MAENIKSGDTLWVVGKITDLFGAEWDFGGVFTDQKVAESLCVTDKHFVAPVQLDDVDFINLPDGSQWKGGYFPLALKAT
jgi:hypothetical protein